MCGSAAVDQTHNRHIIIVPKQHTSLHMDHHSNGKVSISRLGDRGNNFHSQVSADIINASLLHSKVNAVRLSYMWRRILKNSAKTSVSIKNVQ